MTICWKTRWFRLFVGKANWLQGHPLGVRLMWKPRVPVRKTKAASFYREVPCAWDAWLTRYGFVVNQRNYKQV